MNTSDWSRALLTIVFVSVCITSFAQKGNKAPWKKQVSREIDMQLKEDDKKHHLKDLSNDSMLVEMILAAIKESKVTAYSNFDQSFTQKVTYDQIYAMIVPGPDTVTLTDPVTGKEIQKIINHDFDPGTAHKYRVLEDWTFNPITGNTDIHIEGIAPIREVFVNGDFRGMQALCWLKYNEVLPVLDHYEQMHPENALGLRIWNDYFYTDVKPAEKK